MANKTRVDSTQGLIETTGMLSRPIVSPIELSAIEQIHFENIIKSKSRRFWESQHFVQIAATTSQLMALNNVYMQQLITQGPTIEKVTTGETVPNPMVGIIKTTQSMLTNNFRVLGITANLFDQEDHLRYEQSALKAESKLRNNASKNKVINLLAQ